MGIEPKLLQNVRNRQLSAQLTLYPKSLIWAVIHLRETNGSNDYLSMPENTAPNFQYYGPRDVGCLSGGHCPLEYRVENCKRGKTSVYTQFHTLYK